ncbi:MAG: DsbA family protein [Candidatus Micrarchaeota archaeon]
MGKDVKLLATGLVVFALIVAMAFLVSFDSMNKRIDALTQMQYETASQLNELNTKLETLNLVPEQTPTEIPEAPEYESVDPSVFNLTNKVPRGNPDAKVMIVDFSDIGCPFSKASRDNLKQILIDYPNDVVLYFYSFSPHQNAREAHEGLECARLQGKFWEFHDIAFANNGNLTHSDLLNYADEIGLNVAEFGDCLDSNAAQAFLNADYAEAEALGVDGTPFMYINGVPYVGYGPYESFKAAVQKALGETV